ncbi:MAG: protein kinase [Pyrinomonadaceae bacterium]
MLDPGTLLQNRYRVSQPIGRGGMGAVYVATDERFHSIVALKQTFFYDDPALGKAFEREAHLLNHLRHPALPKVSDHFTEGSEQFLVMEFIEGTDLGALLKERRGAFPVADVLRWADELLDVLDYLHNHEPPVVHRDIKPPNIKLTASGRIVLLDFGLAKGTTPAQTPASVTGSVLGYSPTYSPLEQIQGTGTDPCSDLYSLGATLYHLITGVAPVDALARAGAVINNQPDPLRPPHVANAQVPAAVSKVIKRAMAQKSSLRPKSAAEMRDMLRQAVSMAPHDARQAPAPSAFARSQTVTDEATVLEPLAQAFDGRQAMTFGGTTLEAHAHDARPHREGSHPAPTVNTLERPARISAATVLIIAAVLAICAVAAVTLVPRSGAPSARPGLQSDASTGTQADSPEGTQAKHAEDNPVSPSTGTPAQSQTQPADAQADSDAHTVNSQPASTAAGVLNTGDSAAGSVDANNRKPAPTATTENSSPNFIVVQQPAPAPQPTADNRAAEEESRRIEESRRAEELRRTEEARRAEESRRAEEARRDDEARRDEELRRRPPPPPDDWRRPQPPGDQFPPRRPPSFP